MMDKDSRAEWVKAAMPEDSKAKWTCNGVTLSAGQAQAVTVGLGLLEAYLRNDVLGTHDRGRAQTAEYLARIESVLKLIGY